MKSLKQVKGEVMEKEMSLVEKLETIQESDFITSEDEDFVIVETYETDENKYYREIENEKYQEDRQFESQKFKIRKTKETEKLIIAIKRIEKFNFDKESYNLGIRKHTATKDEIRSDSHSRNYIKEYIDNLENKNNEEKNSFYKLF